MVIVSQLAPVECSSMGLPALTALLTAPSVTLLLFAQLAAPTLFYSKANVKINALKDSQPLMENVLNVFRRTVVSVILLLPPAINVRMELSFSKELALTHVLLDSIWT